MRSGIRAVQWGLPSDLGEPQVWVEVAKVEASLLRDPSTYVGPGAVNTGTQSRYATIDHLMRRLGGAWMPHLNLENGQIVFTDGFNRGQARLGHARRHSPSTGRAAAKEPRGEAAALDA